jgi:hypothetical protein
MSLENRERNKIIMVQPYLVDRLLQIFGDKGAI